MLFLVNFEVKSLSNQESSKSSCVYCDIMHVCVCVCVCVCVASSVYVYMCEHAYTCTVMIISQHNKSIVNSVNKGYITPSSGQDLLVVQYAECGIQVT